MIHIQHAPRTSTSLFVMAPAISDIGNKAAVVHAANTLHFLKVFSAYAITYLHTFFRHVRLCFHCPLLFQVDSRTFRFLLRNPDGWNSCACREEHQPDNYRRGNQDHIQEKEDVFAYRHASPPDGDIGWIK